VKGGSTTSIEVETIEVETRHLYPALASTPAASPQPTQEVGTELPGRPSVRADDRAHRNHHSGAKRSRECSKNGSATNALAGGAETIAPRVQTETMPSKPECGTLYCVVRSTRSTVHVVVIGASNSPHRSTV
jgi:hypothetical protein